MHRDERRFLIPAGEEVGGRVVAPGAENEIVVCEVFRLLRRPVAFQVCRGRERKVESLSHGPHHETFGRRPVGEERDIDSPRKHILMITLAHQIEFEERINLLIVIQLLNKV